MALCRRKIRGFREIGLGPTQKLRPWMRRSSRCTLGTRNEEHGRGGNMNAIDAQALDTLRKRRQVLERLTDNERQELVEIDAALERISRGNYGRCQSCEGPIGRQRLRAIPEARYCIACTEKQEHAA
jgi:RNA polymerase-binding transcription factor DksA